MRAYLCNPQIGIHMFISIDVYKDTSAFMVLEPEWNALVDRSETSTPFQRIEFQRVWWAHLGEGELRVLAARDEKSVLVGLASIYVSHDLVLRWVGGEEIADYLDVIASHQEMQAVREAVFRWIAGTDAPLWTQAQFSNIPEWSGTPSHWLSLSQSLGWRASVEPLDVCPILQLPRSFNDYLVQVGGKQRREIRRKMRRASAADVDWYIVEDSGALEVAAEAFLDLMATSSIDKAAFLTPKMRAAILEIFLQSNAAGWFRLCFLEVEGEKVAAYAYFSLNDTLYLYNSGYDLNVYGALSPGSVLLTYLVRHAIETGHTAFDFMQGDEAYKYKFGGQDVEVMRLKIIGR